MKNHDNRCPWCLSFDDYVRYHDEEWGVPVWDDRKQFEFLVLESAQAGLSWSTILKKREGYRKAFADFDPDTVALFTESDQNRLLTDKGIVRNKLKIAAAINNANRFLEVQQRYGSFSDFIWSYVDGKPIINHYSSLAEVPATTGISDRLAKDMKKLGFRFLGSTILYAHMQATGLVNDHLTSCFKHPDQIRK